ncbi:MAG: response regulator [Chloroflexi bacterium]|nr:response regulator [Chloroflexota bacterium]MCI0857367.1 response regulator [Chloroflexota bacterium]
MVTVLRSPKSRLFRKYTGIFVVLVTGALLMSGAVELFFGFQDRRDALSEFERERAASAALAIERFIGEIVQQVEGAANNPQPASAAGLERRRLYYLGLLKHVPAITDISYLDAKGEEQLRVSRISVDMIGGRAESPEESRLPAANTEDVYFSPVYFRNESEPFMTIAVPELGPEPGMVMAEVNLKFMWDVMSQIQIGKTGYAYAVDASGTLVAHPDIGLVLKKTDLSSFVQVRTALEAPPSRTNQQQAEVMIARDMEGQRVLTTYKTIEPLGWHVIVEQPLAEAFAPLYASIWRTGLFLLVGFGLAVVASLYFARRMVAPIQSLQASAAQIGRGDLDQSIDIRTGDELEELAEEFNRMTSRLRESYASLEQKVEQRTQELVYANEDLKKEMTERERAEETERLRTQELEALVHIANMLVQPKSFEEKCKGVLDEVAELVQADWVTLRVPDEGGLRLVTIGGPATFLTPPTIVLSASETLALSAFQKGEPVLVNDYAGFPQASPSILEQGAKSMVLVPVKAGGSPVGLVNVVSRLPNHFTPDRVRVLTAVAAGLGALLENAQAHAAALEALEVKSNFLASMSHEIRTPLNAIIGMADLLSETPLEGEQQEYVRVFRNAGDALLNTINDILDLSKLEAGQLVLEGIEFDLRELLENTVEVLGVQAHEKGLELNCHFAPDVPATVVGDPVRLGPVITNLLGNAIKFTEKGRVEVYVENDPDTPEAGALRFRVSDTGIGIPPDKLEDIFESFVQADSSTTRKYGGTGLGLTISKRLVELMGGHIWVESKLAEGSTFYFTARFGVQDEVVEGQPRQREEMKGLRVLVVDGNDASRAIERDLVASWGASVTEAQNGPQALVELARAGERSDPYQIVILDRQLSGMDGFDVAEQVNKDIGFAGVIIMMLPSDLRIDDIERCRQLGISHSLKKPVKQSELHEAIIAARDLIGDAARERAPAAHSTTSNGRALRILLVEDSRDNRMLVQAYLKDTPHQITIAENGEIAVRKFVAGDYDLVLMDMQMPVMDGYAATRAIRKWQHEQGVAPTAIIALTAYALKEEVQKSLDAGCTTHINKPIKKSRLLDTIHAYTNGVKA